MKYISSDSHFCEPPNFYKERLEKKYHSECPNLIEIENSLFWTDSYSLTPMSASIGAGTKDSSLKFRCNLDEYNKFADLNKRLTYQKKDGATHEILLPNLGFLWRVKNHKIRKKCYDIYNLYTEEVRKSQLKKNFTIIPIIFGNNPKEIFKSLLDTLKITDCSSFALVIDMNQIWKLMEKYEDKNTINFFRLINKLKIPIILHANGTMIKRKFFREYTTKHTLFCINAMELFIELFLRGFFDRYRNIRFIFSEVGLSWVNQIYYKLLYYSKRFKSLDNLHHLKRNIGDVFKKNVLLTFTTEIPDKQTLDILSKKNIMFGSDFPHNESFYPNTSSFLTKIKKKFKNDHEGFLKNNAIKNYNLKI